MAARRMSVCIAQLGSEQGFSEQTAARFLKVFDESWSYLKQKPSAVGADQAPDRQPNELTLVLHGARLELTADLDLAGLDNLRQTLTCYERILQLLSPDREVGSEIG